MSRRLRDHDQQTATCRARPRQRREARRRAIADGSSRPPASSPATSRSSITTMSPTHRQRGLRRADLATWSSTPSPLDIVPCRCWPADRRTAGRSWYRPSPRHGVGGPCPDWVQLGGVRPTGGTVERGFSGAAVWDPAALRVIGLVTAAHTDRAAEIAWMLPVEAAVRLWPSLAAAVRGAAPAACRPPSPEDRYRLADALLEVRQIDHDAGDMLRQALPAAIRRDVRRHPWRRVSAARPRPPRTVAFAGCGIRSALATPSDHASEPGPRSCPCHRRV